MEWGEETALAVAAPSQVKSSPFEGLIGGRQGRLSPGEHHGPAAWMFKWMCWFCQELALTPLASNFFLLDLSFTVCKRHMLDPEELWWVLVQTLNVCEPNGQRHLEIMASEDLTVGSVCRIFNESPGVWKKPTFGLPQAWDDQALSVCPFLRSKYPSSFQAA